MGVNSEIITKATEIEEKAQGINHIISAGEVFVIAVKTTRAGVQRVLIEYECGDDFQLSLEAVIRDIRVKNF